MKLNLCAALAAGGLLFATGCGEKAPQPVEVTADSAGIADAFKGAPPEIRQILDRALAAMNSGDAVAAHDAFTRLQSAPGLMPEQQKQAGQAAVAMLQKMQKDAGAGDSRSQDAMQRYRSSK